MNWISKWNSLWSCGGAGENEKLASHDKIREGSLRVAKHKMKLFSKAFNVTHKERESEASTGKTCHAIQLLEEARYSPS